MSQIDLRLIRAAVTVAEELSFSRAALKLHLSQPALTKQIQDLEATLRVPLFIRDRQRVHMTDAGRAFVEESKLALIHQERAVDDQNAREGIRTTHLGTGRSRDGAFRHARVSSTTETQDRTSYLIPTDSPRGSFPNAPE